MDDLERLKNIAQTSSQQIADSTVFLGICSENYIKDSVCLIQLSLSILMGKPLFLLIQKGVKVSKTLIRALRGYEFYEGGNEQSFKQASEKLMSKAKKMIEAQNITEIEN